MYRKDGLEGREQDAGKRTQLRLICTEQLAPVLDVSCFGVDRLIKDLEVQLSGRRAAGFERASCRQEAADGAQRRIIADNSSDERYQLLRERRKSDRDRLIRQGAMRAEAVLTQSCLSLSRITWGDAGTMPLSGQAPAVSRPSPSPTELPFVAPELELYH